MDGTAWKIANPNAPVDRGALRELVAGVVAEWPADQPFIDGAELVEAVKAAGRGSRLELDDKLTDVDVVSVLRDLGHQVDGSV